MSNKTDARHVLILGASRGIGAAIARELQNDYQLTLVARSRPDDPMLAEVDGISWVRADLSNLDDIEAMQDYLRARHLPDVVIHNFYARTSNRRMEHLATGQLAESIARNTDAVISLYPLIIQSMRQRQFGRWVFLSSAISSLGGPGQLQYSVAKTALEAMARTIAVEEGMNGITANVVAPGFIDTPGTTSNYAEEIRLRLSKQNTVGRAGEAQEVSALVRYLVSDAGGFCNGSLYSVDGGLRRGWFLNR